MTYNINTLALRPVGLVIQHLEPNVNNTKETWQRLTAAHIGELGESSDPDSHQLQHSTPTAFLFEILCTVTQERVLISHFPVTRMLVTYSLGMAGKIIK